MSDDYFQPPREQEPGSSGGSPARHSRTTGPGTRLLRMELTRTQSVVLGAFLLLIGVAVFWGNGSPSGPPTAATPTTTDIMRGCESAAIAALGPEPSSHSYGTAADRLAAARANFDWKLAVTKHRNGCMESQGPYSCGLGECRTTDGSNETWVWNGKYKQ